MKKNQIFISYRRDGGNDLAGRIADRLRDLGYTIFYDIDEMRGGAFNTQIYNAIDSCTDFLLILPPSGLDRCEDKADWVRLEIARALKAKKNVIPVLMQGFDFPAVLPPDIDKVRYCEGVTANNEYFDAVIEKIERLLFSKNKKRKCKKKSGNALFAIVVALIAILASIGAVLHLRPDLIDIFNSDKPADTTASEIKETEPDEKNDYELAKHKGKAGDLRWYIKDSVIYFEGEGDMPDYAYDHEKKESNVPWKEHIDSIKKVVIGDGIVSVGKSAFENHKSLESFELSDSVKSIGAGAFYRCEALKSVSLPKSVVSIGGWAFSWCTSLKSVSIGNSVNSIGECAFQGCTAIVDIRIPDSVSFIGEKAFEECEEITIICDQGSYALSYAKKNGISYKHQ